MTDGAVFGARFADQEIERERESERARERESERAHARETGLGRARERKGALESCGCTAAYPFSAGPQQTYLWNSIKAPCAGVSPRDCTANPPHPDSRRQMPLQVLCEVPASRGGRYLGCFGCRSSWSRTRSRLRGAAQVSARVGVSTDSPNNARKHPE
eukprot:3821810-Rhodomonas_salina.1